MDVLTPTRDNIWQYAQNRAILIMRDFAKLGIAESVTAKILMARGVCKWFAVRREIIKLKNKWRDELSIMYKAIENKDVKRGTPEYFKLVGRLSAMQECRAQVRTLCHSERFRVSDIDAKVMKHFKGQG